MHFLIWLPSVADAPTGKQDKLAAVGLADCAEGATFLEIGEGPDGGAGLLVGWPTTTHRVVTYRPDQQTWMPAFPHGELSNGRYWIGWQSDSPPTPDELLRRYPFDGPSVVLGDGQPWTLPTPCSLPWDAILADDGSYKFEPQARFAKYILACRHWQSLFDQLASGQIEGILYTEMAEFLEDALRINYRCPRELVNVLRLFSTGADGTLDAALKLVVRVDP